MVSPISADVLQTGNWFELFVEAAGEAKLIVDREQRIVFANRSAEGLFGHCRAELLGQPIELLLPHRFRARHSRDVAHFFAAPTVRSMGAGRDLCGLRKDGTEVPIEIGLSPIDTPAGLFTLASIINISARKHADEIHQQMTALVESAEDAILTKSLDGIVRTWNPGAERLLGYRADEIIGKPVTLLLPENRQNEETMILDRIRRGERVAHFETVRQRKDGSQIDVSLVISPIRDRTGCIIGASKIMRDITARRRAEAELHRSNSELKRANQELDNFVYTASHDLRSPLTGVGTLAQWILEDDTTLGTESRERLTLIQGRIERMKLCPRRPARPADGETLKCPCVGRGNCRYGACSERLLDPLRCVSGWR